MQTSKITLRIIDLVTLHSNKVYLEIIYILAARPQKGVSYLLFFSPPIEEMKDKSVKAAKMNNGIRKEFCI